MHVCCEIMGMGAAGTETIQSHRNYSKVRVFGSELTTARPVVVAAPRFTMSKTEESESKGGASKMEEEAKLSMPPPREPFKVRCLRSVWQSSCWTFALLCAALAMCSCRARCWVCVLFGVLRSAAYEGSVRQPSYDVHPPFSNGSRPGRAGYHGVPGGTCCGGWIERGVCTMLGACSVTCICAVLKCMSHCVFAPPLPLGWTWRCCNRACDWLPPTVRSIPLGRRVRG